MDTGPSPSIDFDDDDVYMHSYGIVPPRYNAGMGTAKKSPCLERVRAKDDVDHSHGVLDEAVLERLAEAARAVGSSFANKIVSLQDPGIVLPHGHGPDSS
eukprot:2951910-Karenia_brevis.AAC.1